MSARSTLVVGACGLVLVAAVGVYEQRAVASGRWTAPKQWSSIAPWMPVATIANPPVPLAEELAAADSTDATTGEDPPAGTPAADPVTGTADPGGTTTETPESSSAGTTATGTAR